MIERREAVAGWRQFRSSLIVTLVILDFDTGIQGFGAQRVRLWIPDQVRDDG